MACGGVNRMHAAIRKRERRPISSPSGDFGPSELAPQPKVDAYLVLANAYNEAI
jgi:hypothetical protein